MACQLEPYFVDSPAVESLEGSLRAVDPSSPEISLIDLVLLACDASEDATEIGDRVDGMIQGGAARILTLERDPMLVRAD